MRERLVAVLCSEGTIAERVLASTPQRTAAQRARRREAAERVVRLERMVAFFRDGRVEPDFSAADLAACQAVEQKLRTRKSK